MYGGGRVYQFKDGETYRGSFRRNHPHGRGTALYTCGSSYIGEWVDFLYDGRGKLYLADDTILFDGEFSIGRREGVGRLELPSGLVYEGDYLNGKPHGRGVYTSKLTGYTFQGTFDK